MQLINVPGEACPNCKGELSDESAIMSLYVPSIEKQSESEFRDDVLERASQNISILRGGVYLYLGNVCNCEFSKK